MKALENYFKIGLVIAGILIAILLTTLLLLLVSKRPLAKSTLINENTATVVPQNTNTVIATSTRVHTPSITNSQEPTEDVMIVQSTNPSISPTPINIIKLDWCLTSDEEICIGSISLNYDSLAIVVQKPNNQEDIFITFNDEQYDNCVPVGGYNDRYFCVNLPVLLNRTVLIQIFIEGSETPLAEGDIYLNEALIGSLQPTETTQPPDPYQP